MSGRIDLSRLAEHYDLVVIGGGITGAGVLHEAVRSGAKALLVEQNDFASGTSSWSSKLVHGGLRYLKSGHWRLTLESVRERERLLREAPNLVAPLPFLLPLYRGRKPSRWLIQLGLMLYDRMAGGHRSRFIDADAALAQEPQLARTALRGAMAYYDAVTDDARLVLRLIFDAIARGAEALNYVHAECTEPGSVTLRDRENGTTRRIACALVVNAAGAWAGGSPGAPALRRLRGSHYVFPAHKFPIRHAVSWWHARDQRPMFALPWLGAVVYGTTDLDHDGALETPRMAGAEAAYLLEGLHQQFPDLALGTRDAIACYAGVRSVVASGKNKPSAESRESALWHSPGVIHITGGKLTTFRVTARQVLLEAAKQVPRLAPAADGPLFAPGAAAPAETRIAETPFTWERLRHALRHERVVHLSDLMMRRTRLGLLVAEGGAVLLPELKSVCRAELRWDEARWQQEEDAYRSYWQQQHTPVHA